VPRLITALAAAVERLRLALMVLGQQQEMAVTVQHLVFLAAA
jgi:hypothetical protein